MHLKNKIVLTTGGTGQLGRDVVKGFLSHGATVISNYRDPSKFEQLKAYVQTAGVPEGILCDLTDPAQVSDMFASIIQKHGRLDILLHLTGGFWMGGDLAETPLEKWQQMFDLNVWAAFLCAREAMKQMKKQKRGKIFTVAAKAAVDLPAGLGAYSISKAALLALTTTLAREGKPFNVQVNALLPSIIDTDANRKSMPDSDPGQWISPVDITETLLALSGDRVTGVSETYIKMYGKL